MRKPTRVRSNAAMVISTAVAVALLPVGAVDSAPRVAGSAAAPHAGSAGGGDSLFPRLGNGGYDVDHYAIRFAWHPTTGRITARTTATARATAALTSFNLDLRGLHVRSVAVDRAPARYSRAGSELTVTPAVPLAKGADFRIKVRYSGRPRHIIDADGSEEGWVTTRDGATVVAEPAGAMTWYPVNNTPRDKATYSVTVTAPSRLTVVSNGELQQKRVAASRTRWTWVSNEPMSSYLATVAIGRFRAYRDRTSTGVPVRSYVDPRLGSFQRARGALPRMLTMLEHRFGRYPFSSAGMIVDDLDVGYALETQTRPVFDGGVGQLELVHELGHQWFGNSVTLADWSDIWLNEGFAGYVEWLWEAKTGRSGPEREFRRLYDTHGPSSRFWSLPPGDPGRPKNLFADAVYTRGAMTLQALRNEVGRRDFFTILRRWASDHRYGSVSTRQFVALSEQVSGERLHGLFTDWLYRSSRPRGY